MIFVLSYHKIKYTFNTLHIISFTTTIVKQSLQYVDGAVASGHIYLD